MPRSRSARLISATVLPVSLKIDDELLEVGGLEAPEPRRREVAEPRRRVAGPLDDALAELGDALRADEREVGGHRDRPEDLGRAGVLLRVAPLDVGRALPDDLAEAVLPLGDGRRRGRSGRSVLGDKSLLVGRGDEAGEATAVVHVDAEG